MKILLIGFFAGSVLLAVRLFRNVLPAPYVAALVLVVGLNPFFWEFKDHVLSDLPFLFLVLLSLLLFTVANASYASRGRRATLAVWSGVAVYAAYATIRLALTLIPCFIAHDLIRYLKGRRERGRGWCRLQGRWPASSMSPGSATPATSIKSRSQPWCGTNMPAYLRSLLDLGENG